MNKKLKILIYGFGNPGRQDDGIAIEAIEKTDNLLCRLKYENVTTETSFQLNIEDAETISKYDLVLFVDATIEKHIADFEIAQLKADPAVSFTMHAVSPQFIMDLCNQLFAKSPACFLLKIRGYCWEFGLPVSTRARNNLDHALYFLENFFFSTKKISELSTLLTG